MSTIEVIDEAADVVVVGAGSGGRRRGGGCCRGGRTHHLAGSKRSCRRHAGLATARAQRRFPRCAGPLQVIAGFGERLVTRLRDVGASPGHVRDDVGYTATRTPINHAELGLMETVLLGEAGVALWLNAPLVAVEREGSRIAALIVQTPAGRRRLIPGQVVDASGDAVVARRAGAQFHSDAQTVRQPASLTFKLGGIDFAALLAYARANPADFRSGSIIGDATSAHVNLWGFGRLLARGYQSGLLGLQRTELHLAGWPLRGEAVVNASRVTTGSHEDNWTGEAVIALSRQVLEFARWFRETVPGCAHAYVAAVADRIGVREIRPGGRPRHAGARGSAAAGSVFGCHRTGGLSHRYP